MKKQVLACALGSVLWFPSNTTLAQGSILFSNYGEITYAPVSYGQMTPGPVSYVGSEFTA